MIGVNQRQASSAETIINSLNFKNKPHEKKSISRLEWLR